jgi:hypothetical protein
MDTKTKVNVKPESIISVLERLESGRFTDEVTTEFAHAVQKVGQRGIKAKGKIVITLDIECVNRDPESLFSDGQIAITPDVKVTLPKKVRASKSVFVTSDAEPVVTFNNPDNASLLEGGD